MFDGYEWRNSFAPNDSYLYIPPSDLAAKEIEDAKANQGRTLVGLTDESYQEPFESL